MSTGMIATVGTFDGVHRGHRRVIDTLLEEGRRRRLAPLLITFSNHPLQVVAPQRAPGMLSTTEEKSRALAEFPLAVSMLTFDRELCGLSARKWMERLRDEYGVRALVIGYDNTFGCDGRKLRHEDFHTLGRETGIEIIDAPEIAGISSSAIRKSLLAGEPERAAEMLGYQYPLSGIVVEGKQLGRKLGFPTANISADAGKILPAEGVYAVAVEGIGEHPLPGVVNIGRRPSVESTASVSVECHLPGFSGDLYGRRLTLRFLSRLRDERRFSTLEELRSAIAADTERAVEIFRRQRSE